MAAGVESEGVLLLPSHLSKWGIQGGTVSVPAVAAIGTLSLEMTMTCYVRKVVWCKGRTRRKGKVSTTGQKCEVKKEARLKSVTRMLSPDDAVDLTNLCISTGGSIWARRHCENPAPGNLMLFANISTPDEACSTLVKLL